MMNNGIIQQKVAAAGADKDKQQKSLREYIKAMEGEIKKALPSVMTPERFTRITLSALSSNPKLATTTPQSFLGAMMTAAQLGVEPNTPLGQAYLIPYWNGKAKCLECQFQLGYRGLIDLAHRSGEISSIQAHAVYENDEFEYEYGIEPKLVHKPAKSGRGDPVWYYAVYRTKDGGFGFEVMSVDDIRKHAEKYSKSASDGYSPWKTAFDEMAKKTVLKRVLKYAPLKSDFARGIASDESAKSEISEDMYAVPNAYVEAEFAEKETTVETGQETEIVAASNGN